MLHLEILLLLLLLLRLSSKFLYNILIYYMVTLNYMVCPGVAIGLQRTTYDTAEIGGPLKVCAEMFVGILERNVSVTLTSNDSSAFGMTNGMLSINVANIIITVFIHIN